MEPVRYMTDDGMPVDSSSYYSSKSSLTKKLSDLEEAPLSMSRLDRKPGADPAQHEGGALSAVVNNNPSYVALFYKTGVRKTIENCVGTIVK